VLLSALPFSSFDFLHIAFQFINIAEKRFDLLLQPCNILF
jgi:hypothetical protein